VGWVTVKVSFGLRKARIRVKIEVTLAYKDRDYLVRNHCI
jgi:hypothetical protein